MTVEKLKHASTVNLPNLENIKDEFVKAFGEDVSKVLLESLRNIYDDLHSLMKADYDSGDMFYSHTRFTAGSFDRDMSLASGTQEITGLSKTPKIILFFCGASQAGEASFGFAVGVSVNLCIYNNTNITSGQWTRNTLAIYMVQGDGVTYSGVVSAVSSNSFTISWTKAGSKTGILRGFYIALY